MNLIVSAKNAPVVFLMQKMMSYVWHANMEFIKNNFFFGLSLGSIFDSFLDFSDKFYFFDK
jgi:hypothetical protein